ncbi:hypothetical protein OOT08_06280, partial [Leucobacter sp. M11]|nr:hypothetical protein [Leucobacter sp. M11]
IAVTPVLIGAVSAAHESGEFLTYEDQGSLTFESFAEPVDAFRRLLITGSYPALTWLGVVLLGMLVARGLLAARDRGTERRFALGTAGLGVALAAAGLGVAAWAEAPAGSLALADAEQGTRPLWTGWLGDSGWAALLLAEPHTGTVPDVARGVGIALVVIAACLLLTWALPGPALTALRPVTAAGAAPLTAYTAHILLLNWLTSLEPDGAVARFSDEAPWWLSGGGAIALHLGMVLALGALLAALGRRGPLETLTSTAASLAAQLGAPRAPRRP